MQQGKQSFKENKYKHTEQNQSKSLAQKIFSLKCKISTTVEPQPGYKFKSKRKEKRQSVKKIIKISFNVNTDSDFRGSSSLSWKPGLCWKHIFGCQIFDHWIQPS